jgi:hypothetical protein
MWLDEGGVELEVVERGEVGCSGVEGVGAGEGLAGAPEGSVIGSEDLEVSADPCRVNALLGDRLGIIMVAGLVREVRGGSPWSSACGWGTRWRGLAPGAASNEIAKARRCAAGRRRARKLQVGNGGL